MAGIIASIFRPRYGETMHVRPKHWWNPRQRKIAKIAARLAEFHADEVYQRAQDQVRDGLLYGFTVQGPHGQRVDPTDIRPMGEEQK